MNSTYFTEYVLRSLTEFCYPQGRGTHEMRFMLYFDSTPAHNTEAVQESLVNFGVRRMEHPPYSPDLVPYDLLLFGAIKQALAGQYLDAIDNCFMGVG
jgi:hypothetical protein